MFFSSPVSPATLSTRVRHTDQYQLAGSRPGPCLALKEEVMNMKEVMDDGKAEMGIEKMGRKCPDEELDQDYD